MKIFHTTAKSPIFDFDNTLHIPLTTLKTRNTMSFIKTLSTMGKKKNLDDLQDLNQIKKQEMSDIFGGEVKETKPKKKRWFSSCGGILRQ